MAAQPDLVGTVTLTSGQTGFTVAGINMVAAEVLAGEQILLPAKGLILTIGSRTGATTGTLSDPCPAAADGAAQPCRIRFQSDLARVAAQARNLIDLIGSGNVEALSGLGSAANTLGYFDGVGSMALTDLTAFARSLLAGANSAAMYGALGVVPNAQLPVRLRESLHEVVTDLNSAVLTGFYRNANGSAANLPTNVAGFLEVISFSAVYVQQVWYAVTGGAPWVRTLVNGTWSAWRQLLSQSDYLRSSVQPTLVAPGPATAFSTSASVIPFGTPLANVGGHWSTSLNRFTAPVAGNYLVMFCTEVDRDGFAGSAQIQHIRRNGTVRHAMYMTRGTGSAYGRYIMQSLHAIVPCAANDYVDVYNSAGYVEATTYSNLSITLLN